MRGEKVAGGVTTDYVRDQYGRVSGGWPTRGALILRVPFDKNEGVVKAQISVSVLGSTARLSGGVEGRVPHSLALPAKGAPLVVPLGAQRVWDLRSHRPASGN